MAEKIYAFRINIVDSAKAAKEVAKLDTELRKLGRTRNELLKTERQRGQLSKQEEQSLLRVQRQTDLLRQKKNQLNQAIRTENKVILAAEGSMEKLRAETAQLRLEANKLNLKTVEGKQRFKEVERQIKQNTRTIRDYDRNLSGSSTLVGEYARGAVQAFKSIGAGILIAVGAIRTMSNALRGAVADFAKMETGQFNVQTLLEDFNTTLEKDTIQLIRDFGTEVEDTNKALFDAVSAGIPAAKSIDFLREASILAIGGVTDLRTAVDGLTSILNAYHLQQEEAAQVAAAFFSAQKFGKTTVQELAEAIGQTAPIAQQLNVTYQETLSLYAEITKQGIKTQEATTAIRNVMASLLKPAAETAKVFDELGIVYGSTRVQQVGFLNVFRQIIDAVERGDAELANIFPNIRALVGAGALGSEQFDDFHKILAVVNEDYGVGSSLSKAYELQMSSLQKTMDRLKRGFKTARQEIGEFLAPLIKGFTDLLFPMRTAEQELKDQQTEVINLTAELMNANIEEARRVEIVERLNTKYPDLLKNIDAENIDMQKLADNLAAYNREMVKRIALAGLEEEKQDIIAKQGMRYAEAVIAQTKSITTLTGAIANFAEKGIEIPDTVIESFGKLIDQVNNTFEEGLDPGVVNMVWDEILTGLNEIGPAARLQGEQLKNMWVIQSAEVENTTRRYRNFVDTNKDALEELDASIKAINESLVSTPPTVTKKPPVPGGVGGFIGPMPMDEELLKELEELHIKHEEAVAKARMEILKNFYDNRLHLIKDEQIKAYAAEELRYEQEKELFYQKLQEYPELQEEINAALELAKLAHEQRLFEISEEYRKKDLDAEQAKQEKEAQARQAGLEDEKRKRDEALAFAGSLITSWTNLFERQKQIELSAAGDNAEKREEIERKYMRRQKTMAISQVLIDTARAVMKGYSQLGPILGALAQAMTIATGIAQIAVIARQKFARGGKVRSGDELPGMRGDNTLVLAKPGEVILNSHQQLALGGPSTFKKIGVPGFAEGGVVGAPTPSVESLDMGLLSKSITDGLKKVRVELNVNELHEAEKDLDLINESIGL